MSAQLTKKLLLFIFLISIIPLSAQWSCPSKLGAHLKPFCKKFPVEWAVEVTVGQGWMNDRSVRNAMIFAGFNYSFKKSTFYLEGGNKAWYNSLDAPENLKGPFQNTKPGLRELFYKYGNKNKSLIAGLHSMKIDDYFLVNERGVGLSYRQKMGNFKFNAGLATVGKDFSRQGSFCSVFFLYNVVKDRDLAHLGNRPGQTNFGAMVLTWTPPEKKKGGDEFSSTDEFESESEPEKKLIKEAGAVYYQEFGSWVKEMPIYFGGFTTLNIHGFEFQIEALGHLKTDNNAIVYNPKINRTWTWDSGSQTLFTLGYIGKYDLNTDAKVFPLFSNLFAGEVLRLDAVDMPFMQMAARHNFPKIRVQLKAQVVGQFENQHFREYDFSIGKTLYKNFKLTGMFSRIEADMLDEIYYMARFELRFTF